MTTEQGAVWLDRLTGLRADMPEATDTLIGRWIVWGKGQRGFINSVPATTGEFLVPDSSGRWSLLTESGERGTGTANLAQVPDEDVADSMRTIGDRLDGLCDDGASWREWLDVVPLVPDVSDKVHLMPLECKLREHFGHIEAVCRQPRTHLHVEVERTPVSRARRIPVGAATYLASHTEDWDRRLIRGILPKRILAEVRHDEFNIYENRVTVRLIDNLTVYLNRRIRDLKRLIKVFKEKEDYSRESGGTYQRLCRITVLWGQSIDANEGRRNAEDNLEELTSLKYRLMGLQGSPLYEEVPRRVHVPTTLANTNIFANDSHYRRVAELWREWARIGAERTRSTKELNDEAQRLCRSMDAFSMLLIVRALDVLGYEPTDSDRGNAITRGGKLRLQRHGVELELQWREDGTVEVAFEEKTMVVVALVADLVAGTEKHARSVLASIDSAAVVRKEQSALSHVDVLILYLAASDNERITLSPDMRRALYTVGNDPRNARAGGGSLPVSLWEIGSTERIARALRWFLTGARYLDYPFRIEVPDGAKGSISLKPHGNWLIERSEGSVVALEMSRPPQGFEWERLGLGPRIEKARKELHGARRARRVEESRRRLKDLETLARRLKRARERSNALIACPTCGARADTPHDFVSRGSGCFRCMCRECDTTTRLCGNGHRYPAMLPSGEFVDTDDQEPGWEDRIYGGDILALPARKPDGDWGFVCPTCGQVG